jgi:hypothetical protein
VEDYIRLHSLHPGTDCSSTPILVDFSSECKGVPPPDRKLLALHATCAQVALLSGAAKFLDKFDQYPGIEDPPSEI